MVCIAVCIIVCTEIFPPSQACLIVDIYLIFTLYLRFYSILFVAYSVSSTFNKAVDSFLPSSTEPSFLHCYYLFFAVVVVFLVVVLF